MFNLKNFLTKKVEETPVETVTSDEATQISEEMRQKAYLSLEARRENHEITKIERERRKIERQIELESARAELNSLKEELYGSNDEEEDDDGLSGKEQMMFNLVNKLINPQTNPQPPNDYPAYTGPIQPPQEQPMLDDDTLLQIKSKLPAQMIDNLKQIDAPSLVRLKELL